MGREDRGLHRYRRQALLRNVITAAKIGLRRLVRVLEAPKVLGEQRIVALIAACVWLAVQAHVRRSESRGGALEGRGRELSETGLHTLSDLSLLRLHLLLPGLDQILLELLISGARFHYLPHLVFSVLYDLVGSFLLSL